MNINDKVLINSNDWYRGKFGIVKKFSDITYHVGVEIEGISKIVWFNELDLIKRETKKHVVPMWLIHDTLFHYSNAERAKKLEDGKDKIRLVYVGVDNDYFIDMWQPSEWFDAWIFDNEKDAIKEVEEYNKNII